MLTFFFFFSACFTNNKIDSSTPSSNITAPLSDQKEFTLSPNTEVRFLIEGIFSPASQSNQTDIVFGSYSTSSILEIYLFENNNEEAIWGRELSGENAAIFTSTQDCVQGCSLQIIGKALHTQGTEDITLKIEVRSSLEEGQILISTLY